MRKIIRVVVVAVSAAVLSVCGGDDKKQSSSNSPSSSEEGIDEMGISDSSTSSQPNTSSKENTSVSSEEENTESSEEENTDDDSTNASTQCCNGQVDEGEDCDDGCNDDENDGCTSFCAYSCKEDKDCDDEDICTGVEVCDTASHICQPPKSVASNGESCGAGKACIKGECVDVSCTTSKECVGECDPVATCDTETGTCQAGDPVAENTVCNNGDGYCQGWVCIPNTCGDGVVEPNEECDLGEDNGKDKGCTDSCTEFMCGDGNIEGTEQCDDGNTDNMDGCDKHCKLEIVYRFSRILITTDPAPDYCVYSDSVHKGNSLVKAFPDSPVMLDMIRTLLNSAFDAGTMNYLIYLSGLDDPSLNSNDESISLGQMAGVLGAEWNSQADKLDFPMYADVEYMDDNNNPNMIMPAESIIDNDITQLRTTHPITIRVVLEEGDYSLYNVMSAVLIDPNRSAFEGSNGIEVPESLGSADDVFQNTSGYLCGAIPVSALESNPLPAAFADICMEDYKGCAEDENPPDCASIRNIMEGGCTSAGTGIVIMHGIGGPDADIDGDGEMDGYSLVVQYSAKRVKLIGTEVQTPAEPGCICGCLCESCTDTWRCDGANCVEDCESACTENVCIEDSDCGPLTKAVNQCTD